MDFKQFEIYAPLVEALEREDITIPTSIQEKAIPAILANRDVIGHSETGTGKTLAYLLPILTKVDSSKKEAQAIILTPTHELAIQIQRTVEILAEHSGMDILSIPIIGNVNIQRQVDMLKKKPQIVIGSPGRILELITLRKIKAHTVKTIVIDEADRLLDGENLEVVEAVVKTTQRDRQLLFFSATITPRTVEIGKALMKEPELIQVQSEVPVPENIAHMYFLTDPRDKIEVLRKVYGILRPEKSIVFINQSYEIEKMVAKLKYHGLNAEGIHGSSEKLDRKKVMDDFRSGKVQILVASDLAARGLDIEGVTHIFNLDLPEDQNHYLHRAGRTGRAGKSGVTISIVTSYEQNRIHQFERSLGICILPKDMYKGKIVDVRAQSNRALSNPKKPITRKGDKLQDKRHDKTVHGNDRGVYGKDRGVDRENKRDQGVYGKDRSVDQRNRRDQEVHSKDQSVDQSNKRDQAVHGKDRGAEQKNRRDREVFSKDAEQRSRRDRDVMQDKVGSRKEHGLERDAAKKSGGGIVQRKDRDVKPDKKRNRKGQG